MAMAGAMRLSDRRYARVCRRLGRLRLRLLAPLAGKRRLGSVKRV